MRQETDGATLSEAQARAAADGQKGMMPLPGPDGQLRPFLDYVLSALADAGYREAALVVPPPPATGAADPLRDHYTGAGAPRRLRLDFVVQPEALGTANAVACAGDWLAGRPFVVLNADNLYAVPDLLALRLAGGPALPVYAKATLIEQSGIAADRIGSFALLELDADDVLTGIVEKPGIAAMDAASPTAPISMNCWRGDEAILQACRDVPRSSRGEFELPEAIRLAISRGVRLKGIPATGPVLDLSRREDVAQVAARLRHVEANP